MDLNLKSFQSNLPKTDFLKLPKILVAVSGGIDSMVLVDLFLQTGLPFSMAHANFQLREKDSDLDEQFLQEFAQQHGISIFVKRFDVKSYKSSGNYSTQMAARNLRYDWFEELKVEHHFDWICTAHHLNDSLETFLINLSRGTGLDGLVGISSDAEHILRPLHNFSKESILKYAKTNSIQWREDASNSSTDYIRNKIRHEIFPKLTEIHPEFLQNFQRSIEHLSDQNLILKYHFQSVSNDLFKSKDEQIFISIERLKDLHPFTTYLFHLFQPFGFEHPFEIQKLMDSNENGEIQSKTHRLIKNRQELILVKKGEHDFPNEIELDQDQILEKPLYLRFSKTKEKPFDSAESLDLDKVEFPLRLRRQKTGDSFFPIGMKGSKKISKFFKDEKLSKLEKESTWLLVDKEDRILYVVGKRLDDRFKITENTHNFLNIYLC